MSGLVLFGLLVSFAVLIGVVDHLQRGQSWLEKQELSALLSHRARIVQELDKLERSRKGTYRDIERLDERLFMLDTELERRRGCNELPDY
jgi:uncharacterized membrane protein